MPHPADRTDAQRDDLMAFVDNWPAGEYRLYTGDPTEDGSELLADGGYAPVASSGVTWAVDGDEPSVSATLDFGNATAAWGDVADFWGFHDSEGLRWYEQLPEELDVEAAGPVSTTLTIFYVTDFEV